VEAGGSCVVCGSARAGECEIWVLVLHQKFCMKIKLELKSHLQSE
jgi:hypothetical protein